MHHLLETIFLNKPYQSRSLDPITIYSVVYSFYKVSSAYAQVGAVDFIYRYYKLEIIFRGEQEEMTKQWEGL